MKEPIISKDIRDAQTLPSRYYTGADVFELTKNALFAESWQWVTDNASLNNVDLVPVSLLPSFLDEPLLLAKSENLWRCLSNVCTHRGNLLVDKPCQSKRIQCGYHGRQFDMAGKFVHMPEFEDAKNFPGPKDHLPEVPLEWLGPMGFVRVTGDAPFEETFKPVIDRLPDYRWDELKLDPESVKTYELPANWMLYCDNYLEGFHIPYVHPELHKTLDPKGYATETLDRGTLQIGIASAEEAAFPARGNEPPIGAYYFFLFPNLMLNFYPWGLSLNVVQPVAPKHTKIHYRSYVLDASRLGTGAGGALDVVEMQDEHVVAQVQLGVQSRLYDRGRYSPSQETGVHHFHRYLVEHLADLLGL